MTGIDAPRRDGPSRYKAYVNGDDWLSGVKSRIYQFENLLLKRVSSCTLLCYSPVGCGWDSIPLSSSPMGVKIAPPTLIAWADRGFLPQPLFLPMHCQ